MNRTNPPNSAQASGLPQNPRVIFDEDLVKEIPIRPDHQPTWHDVQRAQMREMHAVKVLPTQPTLGAYLDRFLLKVAGREPLSTLICTFLGVLIAAAQEDPTNWRGWLHGAALAVIGRMMNEKL